jgi:hypothetical protein
VAGNILLFFCFVFIFFCKKITKQKNNKILPATSAYCGAVVRNACKDYFSLRNRETLGHAQSENQYLGIP